MTEKSYRDLLPGALEMKILESLRRQPAHGYALNRHPFTILGVAQPEFNGTLLLFNPTMCRPLVGQPALGAGDLTTRGGRWVFETMGKLKLEVATAQATADLNPAGRNGPRHGRL